MKHTPRPWQIEKGKLSATWFVHHSGAEICMVPNHTFDQESNARLITAAPVLLEACEEAVRHLEANPGAYVERVRAEVKLKEAINKAKAIEVSSEE